jgi:hypothetical protein
MVAGPHMRKPQTGQAEQRSKVRAHIPDAAAPWIDSLALRRGL